MSGLLTIVGTGPGDPELLTIKAARVVARARTIAFFARSGHAGHARRVVADHVVPGTEELRFEYPFTVERPAHDPAYRTAMVASYAAAAAAVALRLDAGRDVALLCEGDPLLYGSSVYLLDRLPGYRTEIVAGVSGMSGCWARARLPMTHGDDVLAVLPGTLGEADLAARLAACDAAVVMKVGRNLAKIRAALNDVGRADRAIYVEHGTMTRERILPIAEAPDPAPYFSLILVPGRQGVR